MKYIQETSMNSVAFQYIFENNLNSHPSFTIVFIHWAYIYLEYLMKAFHKIFHKLQVQINHIL